MSNVYLHDYSVRADSVAPFAQVKWQKDGELTAFVNEQWLKINAINEVEISKIVILLQQ